MSLSCAPVPRGVTSALTWRFRTFSFCWERVVSSWKWVAKRAKARISLTMNLGRDEEKRGGMRQKEGGKETVERSGRR